jgi:hypothetical protein
MTIDDDTVRQRALGLRDQAASIGLDCIASLNQIGPSPDPDTAARHGSEPPQPCTHRAGFRYVQRRLLAGRLPSEVLATRCDARPTGAPSPAVA